MRLLQAWLALILLGIVPVAMAASDTPPAPGTVLITGSDRGVGFALTREFERRGWQVIATCRDPAKAVELDAFAKAHPRVSIEKLDVTDNPAIDALAAKLKARPIDVLVNNAGVYGNFEAQTLAKLDAAEFDRVLKVNSYAPLRISAAFLELVAASRQRKIVATSSGSGSLAAVERIATSGGPNDYYYAMSKAALNMGMRQFALVAAAPRRVTVVMMSPGVVDTDMQREVRGNMAKLGKPMTSPTITAEQSAQAMVNTIERLEPAQNGKFMSREGAEMPW